MLMKLNYLENGINPSMSIIVKLMRPSYKIHINDIEHFYI